MSIGRNLPSSSLGAPGAPVQVSTWLARCTEILASENVFASASRKAQFSVCNAVLCTVAAVFFAVPHIAGAQTYYKCTNGIGKVEFSDKPCSGSSNAQQLQSRSNTLDNSGFRENALRQENQALRERLADQQTNQSLDTPLQHSLAEDTSNSIECTRAKHDADVAASSITPNKALIQSARSQMFLACGGKEPTVIQPTQQTNTRQRPSPYMTRDQYGTIVGSDQCYFMKDAFGATIPSPGCRR